VQTHAMVFVPARPGPWLERVYEILQTTSAAAAPVRVSLFVCIDGVRPPQPSQGWARLGRWVFEPKPADAHTKKWQALQDVLTTLQQSGAQTMQVVDRETGNLFFADQLLMQHRRGGDAGVDR